MKLHHFSLFFIVIEIGCFLTTYGEIYTVRSATELIDVFKGATGETVDFDIDLRENLDFSEGKLIFPLGAFENGTCKPFRGVLHGNGHSIQRLQMNNSRSEGYNNAGFFCKLENATIENIAFDTTCTFVGTNAGTLSAEATGSLNLTNIVNRGNVFGNTKVGGMIGHLDNANNGSVTLIMDRCANEGTVSGNKENVGGLVGAISRNAHIDTIIFNSINHGTVKGTFNVGGLVGYISDNNEIKLRIIDNWNNGHVNGTHEVGGYLGCLEKNDNVNISISESTNNGITTGSSVNVGGFVGGIIENTNITFTLYHCRTNKVVNGSSAIGGFIGVLTENKNLTLEVFNGTRVGGTKGEKGNIGGLVGLFERNKNVSFTIDNSTSRGPVDGKMWSTGGLVGYIYTNTNISIMDRFLEKAMLEDLLVMSVPTLTWALLFST